ncbi:hypothetical protein EVB55_224 [Rhizobium phage RHph_Y68]|uniref:Uncharacterized protein n=1 Tax=Rhizobium phage RHph_Y68 TaxID=2509787 RepID=A0A7S5R9T5_9CAUD|nr:hypothetical protein PP934_gp224 [Rhizobium phage RHph_Y68]QIG68159.1 hypothetical protein EVB55_224 [Rhizobium phage RHph_Y68]
MKIKGGELIKFLDEAWPGDNWYWDHDCFEGEPDKESTYDTDDLGFILYQGPGDDPSDGGIDLAKAIRKWRRDSKTIYVQLDIPKGKFDELKEFVKKNGGKIL